MDQNSSSSVPSTSDERTLNNVMRHEYRKLSDAEKKAMQTVKDLGAGLHTFIEDLGASRELSIAKTKIEEAVMWAVKHITANPAASAQPRVASDEIGEPKQIVNADEDRDGPVPFGG